MSIINVTDVQILDNPAAFTHPFKFQISFESSQDLQEGTTSLRHVWQRFKMCVVLALAYVLRLGVESNVRGLR